MRVISMPPKLAGAISALILAIPLAVVEVFILTRAPWWKPPLLLIEWAAGISAVVVAILIWGLARGKPSGLQMFRLVGAIWCLGSAGYALRAANPGLGFFTVGLALYWWVLHEWICAEMDRSYFDPRMNWYQGLPTVIPGMKCELVQGGNKHVLLVGVARIDAQGAFLVTNAGNSGDLLPVDRKDVELAFSYRNRQVKCAANPVRALPDSRAVGFKFKTSSPDARKDLGDFIEILRGEGHVE